MNPEEHRQFLSSPQSFDLIEEIKSKKIIKRKRKPVHKHFLNLNILLENDPKKLTMRQRILREKFQNKKESMNDLEKINSGLEIMNRFKNKKKYKILIPICTKIRLKCNDENVECNNLKNEEKLKIVKSKELQKINTNNMKIVKEQFNNEEKLKIVNSKELQKINTNNVKILKSKDINLEDLKSLKTITKMEIQETRICKYIGTLMSLYEKEKNYKIILKDCNIVDINNSLFLKYETSCKQEYNLINIESINLKGNKQKMHKKRILLFPELSKKKRAECINKAAFYMTKLENVSVNEKLYKKCIYYIDIIIKTYKERGCVCKVIGEVKWFLNLHENYAKS